MKTQGKDLDVVFLTGVRTPFGTFGGTLKDFTAIDLAAAVSQGLVAPGVFRFDGASPIGDPQSAPFVATGSAGSLRTTSHHSPDHNTGRRGCSGDRPGSASPGQAPTGRSSETMIACSVT